MTASYEQIGLLPSIKTADSAYRTYDESALKRLQQIIILRKLRIPLKEIKEILLNESAAAAIQSFQTKVNERLFYVVYGQLAKSLKKSMV